MKALAIAIQFLTRIPLRIHAVDDPAIARSVAFFPAVGVLLGAVLAVADHTLRACGCSGLLASAITVVLLAALTGALHLDGVSDTCDALFSGKGRDEMLAIMRDPRAGAMGVVGIASVLLVKVAALSSLEGASRASALILMCVFGRWSMVCAMASAPYARRDGKAKPFLDGISAPATFIAAVTAAAIACTTAWIAGLGLFFAITIVACAITRYMRRRLGGITGDTLCATGEAVEALTLAAISVTAGSGI